MNFREDKHIIIPVCMALAALVAYGAWQDMHPPPAKPARAFQTYNIIRDDKAMAAFTAGDDVDPLMVWVGDINFDKAGNPAFTPSPVTPVTLSQREILLLYRMNQVPETAGAISALVADSSEKWKDKGDLINDLFIEVPADKEHLPDLLRLAAPLRTALHENYWIGLFIDRQALDAVPDAQKELDESTKGLRTLFFDADKVAQPGETLADAIIKLNKYDFPFLLRTDDIPDFTALQRELGDKGEHFLGFLIDSDKIRKNTQ